MRHVAIALATLIGPLLTMRTVMASPPLDFGSAPPACVVDAVTNKASGRTDYFMCVMPGQPSLNISAKDWTVDVQYRDFTSAPSHGHFYVEGLAEAPIYHLPLGEWVGEPGHFSQCDDTKLLYAYVMRAGVRPVLRGQILIPTRLRIEYRDEWSDCF